MIKALHDIGKGEHSLNIFEKSTLVILNKITNGKLRRLDNIKNIDNISPALNYIHKTFFGYSFVSGINNLNNAVYHIQK